MSADAHDVFFGLLEGTFLNEPRIWPSSARPRAWWGCGWCRYMRSAPLGRRQQSILSSCSAAMTISPKERWAATLTAPRTRTWRPP